MGGHETGGGLEQNWVGAVQFPRPRPKTATAAQVIWRAACLSVPTVSFTTQIGSIVSHSARNATFITIFGSSRAS